MNADRETALLRLLRGMDAQLAATRDEASAVRFSVRAVREFFGAAEACIAVSSPAAAGAAILYELPARGTWDRALVAAFLRVEHPQIPFDMLAAPIRRRGRRWGVLCVRKAQGAYERGEGWSLVAVAERVGQVLDRIDRERIVEVRARLDRKVMEQLRPRDLLYQILDALRSVTHYDHSSALLVAIDGGATLRLEAEQLAWHKGRSRRIGRALHLDEPLREELSGGGSRGYSRGIAGWAAWQPGRGAGLPLLLAPEGGAADAQGEPPPPATELLLAPIATRQGLIGVLQVVAREAGRLGEFELAVLDQFTPHASIAIQYMRGIDSLRSRMIEAERKNAVATIARGVAHDVNNALGVVLPLVQQMQEDATTHRLDPAEVVRDLKQIEDSVQYCRRIFRNMMTFATGSGMPVGHANLRRAVDRTLAILQHGLEHSGIRVEAHIPDDLPQSRGGQDDLERLLFNLTTNARDAMPAGGVLTLAATVDDGKILLSVRDTGSGMDEETLARIFEPGFTTKRDGNGLGLSVCRAIVWGAGGDLTIVSATGAGTEVRIELPALTVEAQA